MKRRFLLLLLALIAVVSLIAIGVSRLTSERTIEHFLTESAEQRFSLVVLGFGSSDREVDLYSYVDFDNEQITVTSEGLIVLQYGSARINTGRRDLLRLSRENGGYRFEMVSDIASQRAPYVQPLGATTVSIAVVYAVLFAIFGWIFVSMVADPVSRMAGTLETITTRNLKVRLPVPRAKDELRTLVVTLNAMLDDIAATYERQVQMVEDITHDIATPVQIMDGYRQLIERHGGDPALIGEYLETSRVQLARLRDMSGQLRGSLAKERARRVERADATAITERNIQYYRGLHPDLRFDGKVARGVSLGIAPEDLERIEHILIDNAVKYGRGGGRIEIRLDQREFSVRDYGIGIPPENRDIIFQRYRRAPGSELLSPGTGIGLAILTRFAQEYGFRIDLESEPGKGSLFTLHFRDPTPRR